MSLRSVSFYIFPLLVAFYIVKTYCSSAAEEEDPNIATYEEVKNLKSHSEKLLIDVREPEELKETGQIPFSINIPLQQLEATLTDATRVKEFKKNYGRDFPDFDAPLIFTCRSGARAQKGVDIAHKVGFTKLNNIKMLMLGQVYSTTKKQAFTILGNSFNITGLENINSEKLINTFIGLFP